MPCKCFFDRINTAISLCGAHRPGTVIAMNHALALMEPRAVRLLLCDTGLTYIIVAFAAAEHGLSLTDTRFTHIA